MSTCSRTCGVIVSVAHNDKPSLVSHSVSSLFTQGRVVNTPEEPSHSVRNYFTMIDYYEQALHLFYLSNRSIFAILITVNLLFVGVFFFSGESTFQRVDDECQSALATMSISTKVILMGTNFFDVTWTWPSPIHDLTCPVRDCIVLPTTCRRSNAAIESADAIVFHAIPSDLVGALRDLPFLRLDHYKRTHSPSVKAKLVWLTVESPPTLEMLALDRSYLAKEMKRLWTLIPFNWTLTYRQVRF